MVEFPSNRWQIGVGGGPAFGGRRLGGFIKRFRRWEARQLAKMGSGLRGGPEAHCFSSGVAGGGGDPRVLPGEEALGAFGSFGETSGAGFEVESGAGGADGRKTFE